MRRRGLAVVGTACALASVDLALKAQLPTVTAAFHHRSPAWVGLSIVILTLTAALTAIPSRTVAASAAILAGGVLGNLVSALRHDLWVANPFVVGVLAFNLADVLVVIGLASLTVSLSTVSVRYRRHLLPPRKWEQALLRRLDA
jgi:hypothetical protein